MRGQGGNILILALMNFEDLSTPKELSPCSKRNF